MASGPITSWQIDGETVSDFILGGSKSLQMVTAAMKLRRLLLGRIVMTNLDSILKTIALTRWTFVGKVMSLLFNMLSRLVITFLPRSQWILISRLQSPSAVILEPPKIKSDTVSTVSLSISHEVMGPDAMIFILWMLSFKPTFSLSSSGNFWQWKYLVYSMTTFRNLYSHPH